MTSQKDHLQIFQDEKMFDYLSSPNKQTVNYVTNNIYENLK